MMAKIEGAPKAFESSWISCCELNPASRVAKSSARASSAISSPVSGPPGPWQVLACGIQYDSMGNGL